jgi:hypothetical protein
MAIMPDAGTTGTKTATASQTFGYAYMAIMPDADAGSPGTDASPVLKYSAAMPDAGGRDGGAVALYMAMMPDARSALKDDAAIPDAGLVVADYMAMMPVEPSSHDAGRGIVALYAAPVPTNK